MTDSPESRIIADIAINEEEHPSRRVTLPGAEEDEAADEPVAEAIADTNKIERDWPVG